MNKNIANLFGAIMAGVMADAVTSCPSSRKRTVSPDDIWIDMEPIAWNGDVVEVEESKDCLAITVSSDKVNKDNQINDEYLSGKDEIVVDIEEMSYTVKPGGYGMSIEKVDGKTSVKVKYDFDIIKAVKFEVEDDCEDESNDDCEGDSIAETWDSIGTDVANDFQVNAFHKLEGRIKKQYGECPNIEASRVITPDDFSSISAYQSMCKSADWFVDAKKLYVVDRTIDLLGTGGYLCFCKENGHYCYIPGPYLKD